MKLASLVALMALPALATTPPAKKPPAKKPPAHAGSGKKAARCRKHLTVTFAVYHHLPREQVATNGCWTAEYTVQDGERFNLCHDNHTPPPRKKAVAIFDDVNRRDHQGRDPREVAACAQRGTDFWEYLTPPYSANILVTRNLRRLYAELYNSTSGPADFIGQWRIRERGRTVWPMIDIGLKHSHQAVAHALTEVCHRLPNHGVFGLYADTDITRENHRLTLVMQELDACTRR